MKVSISVSRIIILLMLIGSAISQGPPDVPFPFKVVSSNAIPPGYQIMKDDIPDMNLVLNDPNLPDLQFQVLHDVLDPQWALVLPENAAYYGFTTSLLPTPREIRMDLKGNPIPPGYRILPNPEPEKFMVFRIRDKFGPTMPGLIIADAPPDKNLIIATNLTRGVTIGSEYPTPVLPPPVQLRALNDPIPPAMYEIPTSPPPGQYSVLEDPFKPQLTIMLPIIPKTMKMIMPEAARGGIMEVLKKFPAGFGIFDRRNFPSGVIPLPEPELGESLVMSDSSSPSGQFSSEMTIIPRPPPGMKWGTLKESPPNIKWTLMMDWELDKIAQGDASAVGDTGVGTNNAPVKFNAPENAQVLVKTGGIRIHDRERYEVGAGRDYEIQENSDVPEDQMANNAYVNPVPYQYNQFPSEEQILEVIHKDEELHHESSAATRGR